MLWGEFECLCETQREVAARNLEKVGCRDLGSCVGVCEYALSRPRALPMDIGLVASAARLLGELHGTLTERVNGRLALERRKSPLHSPSLACRVFLIKKPYSSKVPRHEPIARAAFLVTYDSGQA